jgi:hypothetical protein
VRYTVSKTLRPASPYVMLVESDLRLNVSDILY